MNNHFQIEFYYRSGSNEQRQTLETLKQVFATFHTSDCQIDLREIDCDRPNATIPQEIAALPCLRRLRPAPERLIVGPLRTHAELLMVLGLPKPPPAIGLDRFMGHPTTD